MFKILVRLICSSAMVLCIASYLDPHPKWWLTFIFCVCAGVIIAKLDED